MNIIQQRVQEKLQAELCAHDVADSPTAEGGRGAAVNAAGAMAAAAPTYILTPEVILYDAQDIMEMMGCSKKTVQKLFGDPALPKLHIGKKILVEAHALVAYCSVTHDKATDDYWKTA